MSEEKAEILNEAGLRARLKGRGGRGDRSPLGTWFWDTDRVLLLLTLGLIAVGLLAVAAASPPRPPAAG